MKITNPIISSVLLGISIFLYSCNTDPETDENSNDCDFYTASFNVERITLPPGGQTSATISIIRANDYNQRLVFEIEDLDMLQADGVIQRATFIPEVVPSEGNGTILELQIGPEAIPGSQYILKVKSGPFGKVFCDTEIRLIIESEETGACSDFPSEECTEDAFYVLDESCIAEAEAINAGNLLQNPGFETDAFGENFPTMDGGWSGDGVTQVSSENGITPAEGSQMLRFDFADVGMSSALAGSEIAQLYVLPQELKDSVNDGGSVTIRQEAFFNRIEGDANTDTEFVVLILAFAGLTADFADDYINGRDLLRASTSIESDACTNTWERLGAEIIIPMNTNYIGIVLAAIEDVENDTTGTEFDGHYMDAASLFILE